MVEVVRKRRAIAPPARPKPIAVRPMSRPEITAALVDIKTRARTLRPPLNHDPERFHLDKSELVRAIERLEDAIRLNRPLPA